jgi:hypothetical protein
LLLEGDGGLDGDIGGVDPSSLEEQEKEKEEEDLETADRAAASGTREQQIKAVARIKKIPWEIVNFFVL